MDCLPTYLLCIPPAYERIVSVEGFHKLDKPADPAAVKAFGFQIAELALDDVKFPRATYKWRACARQVCVKYFADYNSIFDEVRIEICPSALCIDQIKHGEDTRDFRIILHGLPPREILAKVGFNLGGEVVRIPISHVSSDGNPKEHPK